MTAPRGPVDIGVLAAMLADRAEALCAELLPAGTRKGHEWRWRGRVGFHEWRVGSVAGEPGRSLVVHLSGPQAGVWKDWADGERGGDLIDLVAAVLFGGDKGQAVRWARAWLGLDDEEARPPRSTPPALLPGTAA